MIKIFRPITPRSVNILEDYDKIFENIDKVNLMETYYKARKNFTDSLLQKVFMNMPELDNRNKPKKRKLTSFITSVGQVNRQVSKLTRVTFFIYITM